ncbi:MAG: hypothetical protein SF162_01045 [bacterium]|nr:hypothetical protein [bacterium]
MDRRQMCVANVQYKKPTANETKRAKGLLRYLTYRESREEAARYAAGRERWEDHGMGGSVAEIVQRCEALQSKHVLLFSLVYNVNPDLMAMVAPEQREQFVRELTVSTTEAFFDARGIESGVEWSYVLHHRKTDDPQSPGRHDPHTHVVLPGTYFDDGLGERAPLYFSKNKSVDHIALLHDLTERQTADQMDRYVGHDWEDRYDLLAAVRQVEQEVTDDPAHDTATDDNTPFNFWCGTRRTDEQTSAAGYYCTTDDGISFRPLVRGLHHEEADLLARLLYSEVVAGFAHLKAWAAQVNEMTRAERSAFFEELRGIDFAPVRSQRDRTPEIDIEL